MARSYEEWKKLVDQKLVEKFGISSDDMPDWDYQAAYAAKMTPARAAQKAARNAQKS